MVDADHALDYYLQEGPTLKIKDIYSWCVNSQFKFIFLFLHSIELVFLLWIVVAAFKLGLFWIALAVGLTQHLILDIIFNNDKVYSYSYFLLFRMIKGFHIQGIMREDFLNEAFS